MEGHSSTLKEYLPIVLFREALQAKASPKALAAVAAAMARASGSSSSGMTSGDGGVEKGVQSETRVQKRSLDESDKIDPNPGLAVAEASVEVMAERSSLVKARRIQCAENAA